MCAAMDEPHNLTIVSSLREDDEHFDVSSSEAMTKLAAAEDRHFWHATRNRLITQRLRRLGIGPGARFLELGCGGGCVSAHLSRQGYDVVGIEGHASLARRAALRAPTARFYAKDLSVGGVGDLAPEPFDAVGLFDVIEHLDDPKAALEAALDSCKTGGFVTGTVPALQSLWSRIDEVSGHRLRYDRGGLRSLCESIGGARVHEVTYFNRCLVPLLRIQRSTLRSGDAGAQLAENLSVPIAPLNVGLYALVWLEQQAAPLLDRTPLAGASLWFALEKR